MSIRLPFHLPKVQIGGSVDEAIILPAEDLRTTLVEAVVQNIGTDVMVEVDAVTMTLAAWEDPGHWADEWVEALECDHDDVEQRVAELLEGATVERS